MKTKPTRLAPLLIFIMFYTTNCQKKDVDQEISAKIGKTYQINKHLSFKIDSLSDYRCPADMICIWGGDVDLYFKIKNSSELIDTTLNLFNQRTNPSIFEGHKFRIIDVLPTRKSGEIVPDNTYKIICTVSPLKQ